MIENIPECFLKRGLYFLILFNSFLLCASEIPVTTQSEKAFIFFLQGREKFENLELDSAFYFFNNAIIEDSSFSLAYLYSAFTSKDTIKIKYFLSKAYQFSDTISSGEKLLIDISSYFLKYNTKSIKGKLIQLINEYPSDKRVYNLAGIYLSKIGEEKAAIEHFKTAIELDNEYVFAYNNIAISFLARKDYKLALEAFNKVIGLLPSTSELSCLHGKILIAMKSFQKAAKLFDSIYQKDTSNNEALAYLGHTNLLLGRYETSSMLYNKWELCANGHFEKSYSKYFEALTDILQNKIDEARLILENTDTQDIELKIVSDNIKYFGYPLETNKKPGELFTGKSKEEIIYKAINEYEKYINKLPFLMSTITFTK